MRIGADNHDVGLGIHGRGLPAALRRRQGLGRRPVRRKRAEVIRTPARR